MWPANNLEGDVILELLHSSFQRKVCEKVSLSRVICGNILLVLKCGHVLFVC